jgi:hypothetical protein
MTQQVSAKIIEFPRKPHERPIAKVADYEAWYHADEIKKEQPGRA